jgi:nucleoside-diphosphate-sugar epimerase
MAHYFLTGATGFIGAAVARQLAAAGHTLTALVRNPERAHALRSLGATLAPGDITDRASLQSAMRGADGIFHIAGWYHIGTPDARAAWRVNVEGTRNVLSVMRELRIPRGVYTSTLAVNGDTHGRILDETYQPPASQKWLSVYDHTKWAAHYEVAEPMIREGLPLVVVQPGGVYGPGDQSPQGQLLRQYLQRKLPMLPRGAALCWGHVEDTARGHILAMERGQPGRSYVIAGEPMSIVGAIRLAERLTGIPAPRAIAAPGLIRTAATLASVLERFAPLPETMSSEYLRVAAGVTYLGSSARAQAELGFSARPLAEGLRETLEYELHH